MTVNVTTRQNQITLSRSERLRESTMAEHKSAENKTYIGSLMGGELDLGEYARYLSQLAPVYVALEARANPSDPAFLRDARLHRSAAIASDLIALGYPDWRTRFPVLDATAAYAAHLAVVSDQHYSIYLAHHYTRYLGDLSGGQIIATMMTRHYGATDEQLNFYQFAGIDKPVPYKRSYREQIDALELTPEQDDRLIAETRRAYELNAAVFDALGA